MFTFWLFRADDWEKLKLKKSSQIQTMDMFITELSSLWKISKCINIEHLCSSLIIVFFVASCLPNCKQPLRIQSVLTDLKTSSSVNSLITRLHACVVYISFIGYLNMEEAAVGGIQLVDQSNMLLLLQNKLEELQTLLIHTTYYKYPLLSQ